MHKVCKICKNVQWPHKYFSYAFICIYMHKIGKKKKKYVSMKIICNICKNMHSRLCWWSVGYAGGADAALRCAIMMLQCRGSRGRERQRNGFYTALVACAWTLQKFCFQNLKVLAAARRHSPPPDPESLAAASRHSSRPESLDLQSITLHCPPHLPQPESLKWLSCSATRRPSRCLRDSPRPESFAQPVQLATARFSCPSSIAATRVTHSGGLRLQSTTLQRPPHSPQPESLAWLSQWLTQWLAAAQWLATTVAPKRMSVSLLWILGSGFWNTLIAIFGASLSQCHVHS